MGRKKNPIQSQNIDSDIENKEDILIKQQDFGDVFKTNLTDKDIHIRNNSNNSINSKKTITFNIDEIDKELDMELEKNNKLKSRYSKKHSSRKSKKKESVKLQNIEKGLDNKCIPKSDKEKLERERELKNKQLPNVHHSQKLRPSDMRRIIQHTETSIFDEDKCCLWTGYITNLKNKRKGTYINFYFKNKRKVALHRLLFANFKEEVHKKDYIKFSCPNKGKCCNINHMVKFEYNSNEKDENNSETDTESEESENECDLKLTINI